MARAESLILSLRDVRGVDISAHGDEILEINILASGQRSPKQIARDVRSALKAELKFDIDYRKISVAQRQEITPDLESEGGQVIDLVPALEAAAQARRLRFHGLNLSLSPGLATVRVELGLGEREAAGEAEGPQGGDEIARLIARATLKAVDCFLPGDCRFSLSDLRRLDLGGEDVFLVGIMLQNGRLRQLLTGSCPAGGDLQTPVVYATLAALNRVAGRLAVREPIEYELRPTSI
jgi:hypothetical protein